MVLPVTPNVPPTVALLVADSVVVPMFPILEMPRVVVHRAPNVPVTEALARVAAPLLKCQRVVLPVTPNVPPTVAPLVTATLAGRRTTAQGALEGGVALSLPTCHRQWRR